MLKPSAISRLEIFLALLCAALFCFYFIPSPQHEIRVHDTFDGNFSTRHVLIESGHFFDLEPSSTVPGIMNGLPRGVFPRFTEITSLLMYLCGSLTGFALTFILVRLLAFIGIYRFGKDHLGIGDDQKGLLVLIALCFACLPFFIIHGLTVAGVPLFAWAFFNLYKKTKTGASYLVLSLFVLWSNLVLVGFHVLLCFGLLSVFLSVKDKTLHLNLFIALAFVAVLYVLSDYMLFYMHFFNKAYQSSRGEMDKFLGLNLNGVLGGSVKTLMTGDYSTANYYGWLLAPVLICALLTAFKSPKEAVSGTLLTFFIIMLCCAVFINLLDWNKFSLFYIKFPFAKEFNFKRFTSLLPGFFFIMIAAASLILTKKNMFIRAGISLLFVVLFAMVWRGNISHNRSAFNTTGFHLLNEQQTTFNAYFDPGLYRRIKEVIRPGQNTVSYGLSPSPAKYAGIDVLDDYQGDYPKEYKLQFRKAIEGELERSPKLKKYFDEWGSRCYFESGRSFEGRLDTKFGFPYDPQLDVNTGQLKQMNCYTIISGIIIGNTKELNITLEKILVSYLDPQKVIFLYHIN